MRQQARDLAHVHDAFDLVDVVAKHRQARVGGGGEQVDDGFDIVFQIDAGDFVARDHDVVDRDVFQVEDAEQHVLAVLRQLMAGLADHAAQFLGGQAVVAFAGRVDAEQPEQAVADPAQQ
ncbi:hypothetical protein FQZ97_911390 [compost metagenome]